MADGWWEDYINKEDKKLILDDEEVICPKCHMVIPPRAKECPNCE